MLDAVGIAESSSSGRFLKIIVRIFDIQMPCFWQYVAIPSYISKIIRQPAPELDSKRLGHL